MLFTCGRQDASTGGCLVEWGGIVSLVRLIIHLRQHVNHGKWRVHDPFDSICDFLEVIVPAKTIAEQTMHQNAICWALHLLSRATRQGVKQQLAQLSPLSRNENPSGETKYVCMSVRV